MGDYEYSYIQVNGEFEEIEYLYLRYQHEDLMDVILIISLKNSLEERTYKGNHSQENKAKVKNNETFNTTKLILPNVLISKYIKEFIRHIYFLEIIVDTI